MIDRIPRGVLRRQSERRREPLTRLRLIPMVPQHEPDIVGQQRLQTRPPPESRDPGLRQRPLAEHRVHPPEVHTFDIHQPRLRLRRNMVVACRSSDHVCLRECRARDLQLLRFNRHATHEQPRLGQQRPVLQPLRRNPHPLRHRQRIA